MNLTESEYRDIINSRHLINEKIKECKLVLGGKIPPMVDVGRQSSTLAKSKETEKLKKSMTRLFWPSGRPWKCWKMEKVQKKK